MPGQIFPLPSPLQFRQPFNWGARTTFLTLQNQTGLARITCVTKQTQTGKASIGVITLQTQTALARITCKTLQTQTGKGRISVKTLQTQTAKARISSNTLQTQTALARITAKTLRTQTGLARVTAKTLQTQSGKARIYTGTYNATVLPPAAPRLIVTFGNFTIGPAAGCELSSDYDHKRTSPTGLFYCQFHCRVTKEETTGSVAGDDDLMAQRLAQVEAALRLPRQSLLVTLGGTTICNWNFQASQQTAFLIQPELTLIEENARDFHFGFRVSCQFVDNTQGNFFRRESSTTVGTSLSQRRTLSIQGVWTSSPNETAYQQYLDDIGGFWASQTAIVPNLTDQYGNVGQWILAAEAGGPFNDENSLITVSREYWEIFGGRRDSNATIMMTLDNRRVVMMTGIFIATPGFTALQNYTNNADAFFKKELSTIGTTQGALASNQAWVLVDEEPGIGDQNTVLKVTRTYHECIGGLRESSVQVQTDVMGLRKLTVSGTYYSTFQGDCFSAYNNGAQGVMDAARTKEGITAFESHSIPKFTRYNQQQNSLFFQWTITELAYPQSQNGNVAGDDPDINFTSLDIVLSRPFDAQTVTTSNPITRQQVGVAKFAAVLNNVAPMATPDATTMWDNRLRAWVVQAIQTKLGSVVAAAPSIQVTQEHVSVSPYQNQITGTLQIIVGGGGIIWLRLRQRVLQIPARDPVNMASGKAFDVFPYASTAEKLLHREGSCKWIIGSTPPNLFAVGDVTPSGFGFIDTGITAQADNDAQNANGSYTIPGQWMVDRRSGEPYSYDDEPTTEGDQANPYQTCVHHQVENWRYILVLRAGSVIS